MTINEQLHNSAFHKGHEAACPICNPMSTSANVMIDAYQYLLEQYREANHERRLDLLAALHIIDRCEQHIPFDLVSEA